MRRSPMPRRTTPIRRTPLERGVSTLRRTPLKARSAKQARIDRQRVEVKRRLLAERGGLCEARDLLPDTCMGVATDLHERKRRSQGGDPTGARGSLLLCRSCHRFATEFPVAAHAVGLVVWSWESDDEGDAG
jgi:hypothetical protein